MGFMTSGDFGGNLNEICGQSFAKLLEMGNQTLVYANHTLFDKLVGKGSHNNSHGNEVLRIVGSCCNCDFMPLHL